MYPLGGPDALEWPEMLEIIWDLTPHAMEKMKPRGLSGRVFSTMAKAARGAGMGGLLPFGPDEPIMGSEDNTCTIAKARRHFGFEPRPFAEAVETYADRL